MNSSRDIDLLLDQCENYMTEHDIMNIVKQCLHKLCIHQPDNPAQFLKQYFSAQQYEQVREFSDRYHRIHDPDIRPMLSILLIV